MTTTAMAGTATIDSRLLGKVHQCDNVELLRALLGACLDLIYIDPPFNTGITQRGKDRSRPPTPGQGLCAAPDATGGNSSAADSPVEDGMCKDQPPAYTDSWPTIPDYLDFMRPRLIEMRRVLRPTGSILLHCDWRCSHHLRLLLDEVFGPERFVNHLIWSYGLGGSSPRRFARKHDDILFYANGPEYYFEAPRIATTSERLKGQTKKATDVLDIPSINNMAAERTGYPTQKPLALLEVLVEACCPPGGVVGDFFCGSGTALVATARSQRMWIGCDVSEDAVRIARSRLRSAQGEDASGLGRSR